MYSAAVPETEHASTSFGVSTNSVPFDLQGVLTPNGATGIGGQNESNNWQSNIKTKPQLIWDAQSQGGGWDLNGDGKLQKNEADNRWLNGGGDVWVDNSKIDWSGLKMPKGQTSGIFSISTTDAFRKLPWETAATYGGTSFEVVGPSQVRVIDQLYHYQYRSNNSAENMIRNFMTWFGLPGNGQGTDYTIHYNNPIFKIE